MKFVKIIVISALFSITLVAAGHCGARKYFDKGNDYLRLRQFPAAINEYQQVLNNYSDDPLAPECLARIAVSYAELDNWSMAIESQKEILTKYPNAQQVANQYLLIGQNYLLIKDTENAINWLRQRVEKYPGDTLATKKAYFKLGEAYYLREDYSNALLMYQKLIDYYPNWGIVKAQIVKERIGECYEAQARYDEAINIYKYVLSNGDPDPKVIYRDAVTFNIGRVYEKIGDYTQAKIWYQKVIVKYPDSKHVEHAEYKLEELKNK